MHSFTHMFGPAFWVFSLYWGWDGAEQTRDRKCKMGQCPQWAAWRVQTGWEENISRREAQPQGRLLGRLWKFCLWGFYGSAAEEVKLSLIWSGESPEQEGDRRASGSSLQTSFWTGSKSKLYLYTKQLYPI